MIKHFVPLTILITLSLTGIAQPYPEIGKPCPEFTLHNIAYYPTKTATLKDFRGKWLLLDFWSESCGGCIAAFPDKNKIQKEMGDKVEVMLVGIDGDKVRNPYAIYRKKEDLTMPCAFDTILFRQFDLPSSLPKTVLIDDKGIVRSITVSVNSDAMKVFLAGGDPHLPRVYLNHEDVPAAAVNPYTEYYTPQKPFMIHDNGASDTDYLFRSVLSRWQPAYKWRPIITVAASLNENKRGIQLLGNPLENLFFYAYCGTRDAPEGFYHKAILETKDTSLFIPDMKTGDNMFSYSLELPPGGSVTPDRIMRMMQRNLTDYFGYDAVIETRKCPCWRLVASEKSREHLRTKAGEKKFSGSIRNVYTLQNWPFQYVLDNIRDVTELTVTDDSGITGNVDITMDCDKCLMTNFDGVRKALEENGLELVPSTTDMKALIIKDSK